MESIYCSLRRPSIAPSSTPSAFRPQSIATSSNSGISLLSLPRKRKITFLDTSATSLKAPTTLARIENMDMMQLMLDFELARGPLLAFCIFLFVTFMIFSFYFVFFLHLAFSWSLIVGWAGRTRVNTYSTIHKGLDLLVADIFENMPVPNISTDVPAWNKLHESYYECLSAFAKSNLYDHGVFVFAHCASVSVSRIIFDWTHTCDFYVAKDWFGMIDLDL